MVGSWSGEADEQRGGLSVSGGTDFGDEFAVEVGSRGLLRARARGHGRRWCGTCWRRRRSSRGRAVGGGIAVGHARVVHRPDEPFEAGNVRHEHEWAVWKDTKLPDDKLILPGVVSHACASISARRDLPLFWPPRISSLRTMSSMAHGLRGQ